MVARGWQRVGPDPLIAAWAAAALPLATRVLAASAEPLRCGGTWAVGLDLLDNDPSGAVAGCAFPWAALPLVPQSLHRGQVSAVYPGYPQPSPQESDAAHRFRLRRDAAHLDGLLATGEAKRRMLAEPHAWILGLPLTDCDAGASPLVVWEGSHELMRASLGAGLTAHTDVTETYTAARARVFDSCKRVEVAARPGEAILLHRMTIHGVAPWRADAAAPPEGRLIAYFRPMMGSVAEWISLP